MTDAQFDALDPIDQARIVAHFSRITSPRR